MFDWSELPLEFVSLPTIYCAFGLDCDAWNTFPSTLTHLRVVLCSGGSVPAPPASFAVLFPRLVHLSTALCSFFHQYQQTLSLLPSTLTTAGLSLEFDPWGLTQLSDLGRLYGHQLCHLPTLYYKTLAICAISLNLVRLSSSKSRGNCKVKTTRFLQSMR